MKTSWMRLTLRALMSVALALSACGGGKSAPERGTAQAQFQTCSPDSPSQLVVPGVTYYDCSFMYPPVHVVTIDRTLRGYHLQVLADSSDQLATMDLRELKTLASVSQATVAINGYFWAGDSGLYCLLPNAHCATGTPTTTVFLNGLRRTLPAQDVTKEVLMGFTADNASGIQAKRILQDDDGGLVLYHAVEGRVLWDSNTEGKRGFCLMQADGNLVLYDGDSKPVWSSGTVNHPGSRLLVQNDGNVVIYGPDGAVLWATNTVQ